MMDIAASALSVDVNPLGAEPFTTVAAVASARSAGLRYVRDREPGIARTGSPPAFQYVDARGRQVKDSETLARIRRLAIPPAYINVWICADPSGHLQATGRDARGRKQFRYHAEWHAARDATKFARMIQFGESLPRLRRRLRHDLALPGLPRNKVLALLVALLDATRIRIGNSAYARDNRSFGLTTLRTRHVRFMGGRLRLAFRGKGGTEHDLVVDDGKLVKIARRCQQLPGQMLFQYLDDEGGRRGVDSGMVNDYLREAIGDDFTAKDFRTWGATLRAIALMAQTPLPQSPSERALNACIVAAVRDVSLQLRNTPAVCRKSYINPEVFLGWRDGRLHRVTAEDLSTSPRKAEKLALKFLRARALLNSRANSKGQSRKSSGSGSRSEGPATA